MYKRSPNPAQDDLANKVRPRCSSTISGQRMANKQLWKFGAFKERPEWFMQMINFGTNMKRKCKCCGRFRCSKITPALPSRFPSPALRPPVKQQPCAPDPRTLIYKKDKASPPKTAAKIKIKEPTPRGPRNYEAIPIKELISLDGSTSLLKPEIKRHHHHHGTQSGSSIDSN